MIKSQILINSEMKLILKYSLNLLSQLKSDDSQRQRKILLAYNIFYFSTYALWQVGDKERIFIHFQFLFFQHAPSDDKSEAKKDFFNFQFLFSSTCALWRFHLVFSVFYSLLLVSPLITSSFFPLFPQQWMYALYYYLVAMLERKGNHVIKCHCPRSFWEEWKGRIHITWSQRGK